jgi:hypothetical protein
MDKQRLQNYGLSLTSTQSVQHSNMTKLKVQISDPHSDKYEDESLLGSCAV